MPFYTYKCSACDSTFRVFHSMGETCNRCEVCDKEGGVERVYDKIHIVKHNTSDSAQRVKDFISDSKEVLEIQKEEARKNHE